MPRLTRVSIITAICADCDDIHMEIAINGGHVCEFPLRDSEWDTLFRSVAILRRERDQALGKAVVTQ